MTDTPRIKLTLTAEGQEKPESAELTPSLGAVIEIDFGDAETTWRLDYRQPDRFRLRIDGTMGIVKTKNLEITAGGRITRDFIDNSVAISGSLEMEFSRNMEVKITGSTGPKGSSAGVRLTIEF